MRTYIPIELKLSRYKITLPAFVTSANKYSMGLVLYLSAMVVYLVTNHYHISPPRILRMSWLDEIVPFLPYTVWFYVSEYALFTLAYILCKNPLNLSRYFYSFSSLYVVSCLIFVLWPTTYPRHLFPLPENLDSLTYLTFNNLRMADSPANCCPSLHVSNVYLSSFLFLDEDRTKFRIFFTWATIVALSTLTTKQHYLIDLITGFLLAVLAYWFFHRKANYREVR